MSTYPLWASEPAAPPPNIGGPIEVKQPTGQSIPDKTVCFTLAIKSPGNRRKVSSSAVQSEADAAMLHVSKDLLDSEEYKAIQSIDGEARRYVANMALPFPFRPGFYLLPYGLLERVDAKMQDFKATRAEYVRCFVAAYPQRQREAARRLGPLYDPTDYPPAAELGKAFALSWSYLAFDVPRQLEAINRDVFERQQRETAALWAQAADECRQVLRLKFAELVSRAAERLTPDLDGRPKRFKSTTISNLDEFLDTFNPRNITDDRELKRLVDQARSLIKGVDAQTLRDVDTIREGVAAGFAEITKTISEMIEDGPARAINFDA